MAVHVERHMPVEDMVSELAGVDILFIAASAKSLVNNRGQLIQSMRKKGLSVAALVPSQDYHPDAEALGINMVPFDFGHFTNPWRKMKQFGSLVSLIRKIMPKAVFACAMNPVFLSALAVRMAGVANIYYLVDRLGCVSAAKASSTRSNRRYTMLRLGLAGRLSRLMIFQNPGDLQALKKSRLLRRQSSKLVVNGPGVDLERYAFSPVSMKPMVFLCLADLVCEKGLHEFVDAAKRIRQEFPEAIFRVVGADNSRLANAIGAEEIVGWKASGLVEIREESSDDAALLAQCSVIVVPSCHEEASRDILKAMSCGRAIITCGVAGCRDPVVDGINGFIVKPGDPEALAEAMRKLLRQPERISVMGRMSRHIAEAQYDAKRVNEGMLKEIVKSLQ